MRVVTATSTDGITWSDAVACNGLGDGTTDMTAFITKTPTLYEAIVMSGTSISYYTSSTATEWTKSKDITLNGITVESFVKDSNVYRIYGIDSTGNYMRFSSQDMTTWYSDGKIAVNNVSGIISDVSVFVDGCTTYATIAIADNKFDNPHFAVLASENGMSFGMTSKSDAVVNSVTVNKGVTVINPGEVTTVVKSSTPSYYFRSGDKIRIDYTGIPEIFNASNITSMKIEVYGAAGGSINGFVGGRGGYVYGTLDTSKLKKFNVVIGSMGGYGDGYGYNGGGTVTDSTDKVYHGGGATDIRTSTTDLTSRLLVAGGGGSADASDGTGMSGHDGGNGGGWVGIDGVGVSIGKAATQTSGGVTSMGNLTGWTSGVFGYGSQNKVTTDDVTYYYGAGGGGYYGAGNGSQGAGGGSSYVAGNSECPTTHPDGYVLTESGTDNGMSDDNGYVVITVLTVEGNDGSKRTLTGSGPMSWNSTMDATGISDIVGNLSEMVTGIMVKNKSFYVFKDNDAAIQYSDHTPTSASWRMIDASGNYITTGTGVALNYTADVSAVDFGALATTNPSYIAKALGIVPVDAVTGTGKINAYIGNNPYYGTRGSYYGGGDAEGIYAADYKSKWGEISPYTGFRIAYYK